MIATEQNKYTFVCVCCGEKIVSESQPYIVYGDKVCSECNALMDNAIDWQTDC